MKLWMSAEEMEECGKEKSIIRNEIEPRINELIKHCKLGNYVEWAVITIILNEKGPKYKEIIRRSLKNKELEFRLKIGLATTSQTEKPILYPCLHTKFYQNSADYGVLFHFAIMAMGLFFCFSRFSRFYVSDLIFWDIQIFKHTFKDVKPLYC